MEKKKRKNHLLLVKSEENAQADALEQLKSATPVSSAFVKQMTDYADGLDRMIEAILGE